jgi:hypothetical protein
MAYSNEAKDALSVIDSSTSSSERDTPVTPEFLLADFGIEYRHTL